MTGIILILHNRESQLIKNDFVQFLSEHENIHLCFVNNGSTDYTLDILLEIEELFPHAITIIDLKTKREKDFALRNGFRILMRNKNISDLSFSNTLDLQAHKSIIALNKKIKS